MRAKAQEQQLSFKNRLLRGFLRIIPLALFIMAVLCTSAYAKEEANFDAAIAALYGGTEPQSVMQALASDYSAIEALSGSEGLKSALESYAQMRAGTLTGISPKGYAFPNAVILDESRRGELAASALKASGISIKDARVYLKVRSVSGTTLEVYEWCFYVYEEKGFEDISGFGIEHSIGFTGSNISSDSYREDTFAPFTSSAYSAEPQGSFSLSSSIEAAPVLAAPAAYLKEKAIEYSDKYALSYNPAYANYNGASGGDCANFVSQCLAAGGLPMDKDWFWYSKTNASNSFIGATSLNTYLLRHGKSIDNPANSEVFPGNPVFYGYSTAGYAHAAFCVGYNAAGTALINAHNTDYYHVAWTLGNAWGKRNTIQLVEKELLPKLSSSVSGNIVTLSWEANAAATDYNICVYKDTISEDNLVYKKSNITGRTLKLPSDSGSYIAQVESNESGAVRKGGTSIFNVTAQPASGLKLEPQGWVVRQGSRYVIDAVLPSGLEGEASLTWSSSNSAAVSIPEVSGRFSALAPGVSTVTASFGTFRATCLVIVQPYIEGLEGEQTVINRLSGGNRFVTAAEICRAGWQKADTVVLANAYNYADALAGAPLAYALNAPILMTAANSLDANTRACIEQLGAKNIVLVGGESSISQVLAEALSKDYKVSRVSGGNRYQTALKIAVELEKLTGKRADTAIIATGANFADALSISPYAAIKGYPVLYANPVTGLSAETAEHIKGMNALLVGGEASVPNSVLTQAELRSSYRLSGGNRYVTSFEIAKYTDKAYGKDVSIATGQDFPDALTGSVLAAKLKTPLLLCSKIGADDAVKEYIAARKPQFVYLFGGGASVPNSVIIDIFWAN
jgi:putative cell wall-binding protein